MCALQTADSVTRLSHRTTQLHTARCVRRRSLLHSPPRRPPSSFREPIKTTNVTPKGCRCVWCAGQQHSPINPLFAEHGAMSSGRRTLCWRLPHDEPASRLHLSARVALQHHQAAVYFRQPLVIRCSSLLLTLASPRGTDCQLQRLPVIVTDPGMQSTGSVRCGSWRDFIVGTLRIAVKPK